MKTDPRVYDVVIIGAGGAGLMCAIESAKRGRKTWIVDHAKKTAEKIRISGGGRCNFTNYHVRPETYISQNPHFCKSALKQFTQDDFIKMVENHGIKYHEKNPERRLGQLFCDHKSQDIIDMLLSECFDAGGKLDMETNVERLEKHEDGHFEIHTNKGIAQCKSLVIATGGLSIPKIGASKFGYDIAKQFDLKIIETTPALVPLTFQTKILERCKNLSGLSVKANVSCNGISFSEGLLFTHRGLSGPSILQISSYWHEGDEIIINLAPATDMVSYLKDARTQKPKQDIQTILSNILPARLAQSICEEHGASGRIADMNNKMLGALANAVNGWRIKPAGSEGYRTAEVTRGGVDTNELSSKTMECKKIQGLYFIGEVVDVTGWLGGYNFQWAWSSGFVAGQYV